MSLRVAIGLALLSLTTAQAAAAADYRITYTGTIRASDDATGEFGGSGASLNGLPFLLVYDFTFPAAFAQVVETPTRYTLVGGSANGGGPGFLNARLTINGVTQAFSGSKQSSLDRFDEQAGFYDAVFEEAADHDFDSAVQFNRFVQAGIGSEINEIIATTDVTTPYSYVFQPGDTGFGSFYILRTDTLNDVVLDSASGQFNYDRVSVVAAGIPEPSTWLSFIAGFGTIGACRRRAVSRRAARGIAFTAMS